MTRQPVSNQVELYTLVDRVIVPALVERFLAEHSNIRRSDGDPPLAPPKDAA